MLYKKITHRRVPSWTYRSLQSLFGFVRLLSYRDAPGDVEDRAKGVLLDALLIVGMRVIVSVDRDVQAVVRYPAKAPALVALALVLAPVPIFHN